MNCHITRQQNFAWLPPTSANYPTLQSSIYITAGDFLAIALKAYYAACRDRRPPDGETWLHGDAGHLTPYSCAEDLCCDLRDHIEQRLYEHANLTGNFVDLSLRPDVQAARMQLEQGGVA